MAIHTHPFESCQIEWITQLNSNVVSLAVPFFFIVSGYFLGSKLFIEEELDSSNRIIVRKYLIRILKMYLLWMAIYTPLAIIHYFDEEYSIIRSVGLYTIGLIFVGEQYNNWVLWYLLSSIYATITILLLSRSGITSRKLVFISAIASFLVAAFSFIGNYTGDLSGTLMLGQKLIQRIFSSGRIFNGLIYIPIGILLSKKRISDKWNWILFFAGFVGRIFITDRIVAIFLLIIASIGLFGIIEKIELPKGKGYFVLRNMSTTIYLIHLYVWTGYYMSMYGIKTYGTDCFIVTSMLSTVLAYGYYLFSSRGALNVVRLR